MKLKFIGTEAGIGGTTLMRLGQEIELPDDAAKQIITGHGAESGWAGGVPLLPAERFDGIFGTDDEAKKTLKKYQDPGARMNAPQEFQDKLRSAYEALEQWRQESAPRKQEPQAAEPTETR